MLLLFAISIVCFLALIGAGVAIVRHVRTSHRRQRAAVPPAPNFTQHLYAASEYGSVRVPRQIGHQTVQAITARKTWNASSNASSQAIDIHPAAKDKPVTGRRKGPQAAGAGRAEFAANRADWTHFDKDYGDLADPHPSRPIRAAASLKAASKRRY